MATSQVEVLRTGNKMSLDHEILDIFSHNCILKDALQAQIVIKELSEISENKSTNGGEGDGREIKEEYIENKTVEVI